MNLENEIKIQEAYMRKIQDRLSYFESKTITELEISEINEYLSLLEEMEDLINPIVNLVGKAMEDVVIPIMENVMKIVKDTPEYKAEMKYQERVLNRR